MARLSPGVHLAETILCGMGVDLGGVRIASGELRMEPDEIAMLQICVPYDKAATPALIEHLKAAGLMVDVWQMPPAPGDWQAEEHLILHGDGLPGPQIQGILDVLESEPPKTVGKLRS